MSDLFEQPDHAATPLTPEEMRGLIPAHVAYRGELNAAEQENIARGQAWALSRRRDLLSEKFIKDYWQIPIALRQLFDDVKAWIEHNGYAPERNRATVPSQADADSPVPERQRPPVPPAGRSSGDAARA